MVTDFVLVDTKHESVENGRRQIVGVNLAAFVGWNLLMLLLI